MSRLRRHCALWLLLLAAVGLWYLPAVLTAYPLYVAAMWLVFALCAAGLNLIMGYAGQVSLAQGAFLGIGAYATALLTAHAGWPWWAAAAFGTLASFVIGLLLGLAALRVQHHYLAFITLAFSTLVFLVARNEVWLTGGVFGIADITRPTLFGHDLASPAAFFRFVLLAALVAMLVFWWIVQGPWGLAFAALRENPLRAESLGLKVRLYKLFAFGIGSAIAGFAGSLYAPLVQFIDPTSFAVTLSLTLLLTVVTGGMGYLLGPFVGALISVVVPETLRMTGGYYLIIQAGLVIVLLVACPGGLLGLLGNLLQWLRNVGRTQAAPGLEMRADV
ncbi:branched-chain amino acid ABC transporter permease [Pseudomonas sp. NPDC007930]|uniref:branched-chain amino acid ABC transporter permease n=1 Tax=Pseudomonas sp. NPDC007930 TaxID=3364417 RepID=UPI0036E6CF96